MGKKKKANFIGFARDIVWSEAFKDLSANEFRAYFMIKSGFTGKNNGSITLTYKQVGKVMRSATFSNALKGLQEKGWLSISNGGLGQWRNEYELTWSHDCFGKPHEKRTDMAIYSNVVQ